MINEAYKDMESIRNKPNTNMSLVERMIPIQKLHDLLTLKMEIETLKLNKSDV